MVNPFVVRAAVCFGVLALAGCGDTPYTAHNYFESDATKRHDKNIFMDEPLIANQNNENIQSNTTIPKNPPEPLQDDRTPDRFVPLASTSENVIPPAVQDDYPHPSR